MSPFPLEIAVASTPGLTYIRSNTVFALGFIRLQFEYGRDYNFVRQQVTNRLKDAALPTVVTPVISPAGGISEILRYQLKGPPGMDLIQLKTLQDWVVERKLRIVPGVADISSVGRENQGIPGRNRPRSHAGLRPDLTADHQRDIHEQRQCRRPHDRRRRTVGQRARRRRSRLNQRH